MTKQRTWRIKKQGPGPTNGHPLRITIPPPLAVQLATPLQLTAWPRQLVTPRPPCPTTTVLIPSCIYSATWGLMNREVTWTQTESLWWESLQSELQNSGGLNAMPTGRRVQALGVGAQYAFLTPWSFAAARGTQEALAGQGWQKQSCTYMLSRGESFRVTKNYNKCNTDKRNWSRVEVWRGTGELRLVLLQAKGQRFKHALEKVGRKEDWNIFQIVLTRVYLNA